MSRLNYSPTLYSFAAAQMALLIGLSISTLKPTSIEMMAISTSISVPTLICNAALWGEYHPEITMSKVGNMSWVAILFIVTGLIGPITGIATFALFFNWHSSLAAKLFIVLTFMWIFLVFYATREIHRAEREKLDQ